MSEITFAFAGIPGALPPVVPPPEVLPLPLLPLVVPVPPVALPPPEPVVVPLPEVLPLPPEETIELLLLNGLVPAWLPQPANKASGNRKAH